MFLIRALAWSKSYNADHIRITEMVSAGPDNYRDGKANPDV